jgi:hypothetical protein
MRRTIPHHQHFTASPSVVMVVVMSGCCAIAIAVVARLFHRLFHLVIVQVLSVVLVQRLQARSGECNRGSNQ